MPIYEFGCGSCKDIIEKRQSYDDPPPTCCGTETERLISLTGAPVFCGPGTYATDYGNMPHHLNPADQRARANREWHENDLMVAQPGKTNPDQKKEIKKLSERDSSVCLTPPKP